MLLLVLSTEQLSEGWELLDVCLLCDAEQDLALVEVQLVVLSNGQASWDRKMWMQVQDLMQMDQVQYFHCLTQQQEEMVVLIQMEAAEECVLSEGCPLSLQHAPGCVVHSCLAEGCLEVILAYSAVRL